MTRSDLTAKCRNLGVSVQHVDNLMRSAYKKFSAKPWQLDYQFPKTLVESFESDLGELNLKMNKALASNYDGSVKFLWDLADGYQIESVLMPEKARITLCISSQVGCAQACTFCHTGRMGLKRNLKVGEIVGQIWKANRWMIENPEWFEKNRLDSSLRVTNIVFMGMGEPLDNVPNVANAIQLMTDPHGLALGMSHISVSTAGHLDGLKEIFELLPQVRIALSLHSPFSNERSRIMPINRKWNIQEVLKFLAEQKSVQKNGLLIQYTLISGVNDSPEHAQELLKILEGVHSKVNLIPLNEIEPSRFQAPNPESVQTFQNIMHRAGLRTMIRFSKGQDIAAACGQLVTANA